MPSDPRPLADDTPLGLFRPARAAMLVAIYPHRHFIPPSVTVTERRAVVAPLRRAAPEPLSRAVLFSALFGVMMLAALLLYGLPIALGL